jgi:hypothetical protein
MALQEVFMQLEEVAPDRTCKPVAKELSSDVVVSSLTVSICAGVVARTLVSVEHLSRELSDLAGVIIDKAQAMLLESMHLALMSKRRLHPFAERKKPVLCVRPQELRNEQVSRSPWSIGHRAEVGERDRPPEDGREPEKTRGAAEEETALRREEYIHPVGTARIVSVIDDLQKRG